MKYSIDTSAILDGWSRYYPPDVFPDLWDKRLDHLIAKGALRATEMVLQELERKHDEVYQWAKQRDALFIPINEEIQTHVSEILTKSPRLIDERSGRSNADPFVIALARMNGCAVLTGEKPTNRPNRPKIPDVCDAFGIRWLSILEVFRQEGWTFVISP